VFVLAAFRLVLPLVRLLPLRSHILFRSL
jgi:hypothetical protein